MDIVMIKNSEGGRDLKRNDDYKANLQFDDQVNVFQRFLGTAESAESDATEYRRYTFIFVEYADVGGSRYVSIDGVNKLLRFTRLLGTCGYLDGKLIPTKHIDLYLLGSARRTFHVV